MELYNFFTEVTSDQDKIEEIKICLEELKQMSPPPNFATLVEHTSRHSGNPEYSIIGQVYGEDTNIGDLELLVIFSNLQYTWFDARMPSIQMTINRGKEVK